jgi:hypothetical protein
MSLIPSMWYKVDLSESRRDISIMQSASENVLGDNGYCI